MACSLDLVDLFSSLRFLFICLPSSPFGPLVCALDLLALVFTLSWILHPHLGFLALPLLSASFLPLLSQSLFILALIFRPRRAAVRTPFAIVLMILSLPPSFSLQLSFPHNTQAFIVCSLPLLLWVFIIFRMSSPHSSLGCLYSHSLTWGWPPSLVLTLNFKDCPDSVQHSRISRVYCYHQAEPDVNGAQRAGP